MVAVECEYSCLVCSVGSVTEKLDRETLRERENVEMGAPDL